MRERECVFACVTSLGFLLSFQGKTRERERERGGKSPACLCDAAQMLADSLSEPGDTLMHTVSHTCTHTHTHVHAHRDTCAHTHTLTHTQVLGVKGERT